MVANPFPVSELQYANSLPAYGDVNLFCTCGPVDTIDQA